MRRAVLIAILSGACSSMSEAGGELGGTVLDGFVCPADLVNCGHVWVCGDKELCIDDDTEIAASGLGRGGVSCGGL